MDGPSSPDGDIGLSGQMPATVCMVGDPQAAATEQAFCQGRKCLPIGNGLRGSPVLACVIEASTIEVEVSG